MCEPLADEEAMRMRLPRGGRLTSPGLQPAMASATEAAGAAPLALTGSGVPAGAAIADKSASKEKRKVLP